MHGQNNLKAKLYIANYSFYSLNKVNKYPDISISYNIHSAIFIHPFSKQLRRNCMERIHLSMLQRSKRLDLDPRIQHSCLHDLARFCTESKDPEEKGSVSISLSRL